MENSNPVGLDVVEGLELGRYYLVRVSDPNDGEALFEARFHDASRDQKNSEYAWMFHWQDANQIGLRHTTYGKPSTEFSDDDKYSWTATRLRTPSEWDGLLQNSTSYGDQWSEKDWDSLYVTENEFLTGDPTEYRVKLETAAVFDRMRASVPDPYKVLLSPLLQVIADELGALSVSTKKFR